MICAIYARKSNEQTGVADEQRSVARQVEHAQAYAVRKGWIVSDDHIFIDDGISGAEFASRPGFVRLMAALKPRAPFSVLIMSESSRLGREQFETGYALKQLSQAGVRCYSYLDGREIVLDTATDKFMMAASTFGAELEREKAHQRMIDTMARKARAAHVTGGRAFGYTNVEITGPDGTRSHVERIIHPEEAAVVRRIFELSGKGTGFTRIAKLLNEERALCPRPAAGRPAGWAPTSVRAILMRPAYRGEVVYNTTRKKDDWGQRKTSARPEDEWIRAAAPSLRVVSDDLWYAANARLAGLRRAPGAARGSRPAGRDIDSRYLLSGFARCGVCGGALCVLSHAMVGCVSHQKRGARACENALRLPMALVDHAVLTTLGGSVLKPSLVLAVIDGLLGRLTPRGRETELQQRRSALVVVEREIAHLTTAIAEGGQLDSLLGALRDREARRRTLVEAIAQAGRTPRVDRKAIEQTVRERLHRWQTLLTRNVADGRQLLREVLAGPLKFTPDGRTYRFEGEARIGHLLAGTCPESAWQLVWCARRDSPRVDTLKFQGIAA